MLFTSSPMVLRCQMGSVMFHGFRILYPSLFPQDWPNTWMIVGDFYKGLVDQNHIALKNFQIIQFEISID